MYINKYIRIKDNNKVCYIRNNLHPFSLYPGSVYVTTEICFWTSYVWVFALLSAFFVFSTCILCVCCVWKVCSITVRDITNRLFEIYKTLNGTHEHTSTNYEHRECELHVRSSFSFDWNNFPIRFPSRRESPFTCQSTLASRMAKIPLLQAERRGEIWFCFLFWNELAVWSKMCGKRIRISVDRGMIAVMCEYDF